MNEPIHIHFQKGDKESKYLLLREDFEINEAFSYKLSPRVKREAKKIIFEYFELIEKEWDKHHKRG